MSHDNPDIVTREEVCATMVDGLRHRDWVAARLPDLSIAQIDHFENLHLGRAVLDLSYDELLTLLDALHLLADTELNGWQDLAHRYGGAFTDQEQARFDLVERTGGDAWRLYSRVTRELGVAKAEGSA